ncbi:hypothetical protein TWF281_011030 [Arthrobotrys megalospora]
MTVEKADSAGSNIRGTINGAFEPITLPAPSSSGNTFLINDRQVVTHDKPIFIGWCGGGTYNGKLYVLNGCRPNKQWRAEGTSGTLEEISAAYMGLRIDEQGFAEDCGGTGRCWQGIKFRGAARVPHGSTCRIYYLVTWEGLLYDRYAVTLRQLTTLRMAKNDSKRVTGSIVLNDVKAWVDMQDASAYISNHDWNPPSDIMGSHGGQGRVVDYAQRRVAHHSRSSYNNPASDFEATSVTSSVPVGSRISRTPASHTPAPRIPDMLALQASRIPQASRTLPPRKSHIPTSQAFRTSAAHTAALQTSNIAAPQESRISQAPHTPTATPPTLQTGSDEASINVRLNKMSR